MTSITGRDMLWTLNLFFSLLIILMVSTSTKVKDNKRMVNFLLASVSFWICEIEQQGVIHNLWPILLLNASWAKVTNRKREWEMVSSQEGVTCWRWKDSSSILCETGLHSMCCQMEISTSTGNSSNCRYICDYVSSIFGEDRSTLSLKNAILKLYN